MKKKGFTLIELLAVIVILAIIALIATPLVLNTIEKARMGAAEISAYAYAEEVERYIMLSELDPTLPKLQPGVEYQLSSKKFEVASVADPATTYINDLVSIKGDKPDSGYVILDSEYRIQKMEMIIKSYPVTCENDECKITGSKVDVEEEEKEEESTTKGLIKIVYLDPTDLTKKCDASNSVSTNGVKIGCMKWYVYDQTDTTYTMILDHNTTPTVAWNSAGTNAEMKEVKTELDNLVLTSNWEITPRLITADELAKITGAKEILKWDSSKEYKTPSYTDTNLTFDINMDTHISWYYLDGQGNTYSKGENGWQLIFATAQGESKFAWLYDNTYGCANYGCNISDDNKYEYGTSGGTNYIYGYWTSTPLVGDSTSVFYVSRGSRLDIASVKIINNLGVRPVITISKTALD